MITAHRSVDLPGVHLSEWNKEKIRKISINLFAVYYVAGNINAQYDFCYLPKYESIAQANSFAPEVYVIIEEDLVGTKLKIKYCLQRRVYRLLLLLITGAFLLSGLIFAINTKGLLFSKTPEAILEACGEGLSGLILFGGYALIVVLFSIIGLQIEATRFSSQYKREIYKCILSHSGLADTVHKKTRERGVKKRN